MNFIESIKIALKSLRVNKMRTFLTMLGIIIGISSVITVVALGNGSKGAINSEFDNYGSNSIYLWADYQEAQYRSDYLMIDDYELLNRTFEDIIVAKTPHNHFSGSTFKNSDAKEKIDISVTAISEEYDNIVKFTIERGRFLTEADVISQRNVAVIEKDLAMERFGREDVLGEKLVVNRKGVSATFVIVGVYEPPKSLLPEMGNSTKTIYIPHSTARKILNIGSRVNYIEYSLKRDVDEKETIQQMTKVIARKKNNVGKNIYQGQSAEGQLDIINNVMKVLTTVVGAIAAISLLVGAIGIMNIMLVSVTERTREIGIRKAIGATRRDILIQFLIEAIIISGIGGLIGTGLGISFAKIASILTKIPAKTDVQTILIATLFSSFVGIVAGLYPANKAAKLDPIDSLRYE